MENNLHEKPATIFDVVDDTQNWETEEDFGHPLLNALAKNGAEVADTLDRLANEEDIYLDYLYKLPDDESYAVLRKAVDEGDCVTAAQAVHTLKGEALNLGLLPLSDACMDMLLNFRAQKNDEAMARMDTVEASFEKFADIIRSN